ncbi:hypothetical protein AB0M36_17570 [Actinoplanes sp. NPDC051346]|uniref:hypothetical protein n=1 Tax=Actinoplanes sp. NPDC051346 TaxID=3155048 RepID=UPI00343E7CA8
MSWTVLTKKLSVSFGLGAFTTPYVSSQRLIVPDLLGPVRGADEKLVGRANSLVDGATRIAALAGPAVGGVLIALLGPGRGALDRCRDVFRLVLDRARLLAATLITRFTSRPIADRMSWLR